MDQCEDREDGVRPSKTPLCGEHESRSKAQRNEHGPGPGPGPEPSCVSLKSDRSMVHPLAFKGDQRSAVKRVLQKRDSLEHESSCLSLKSDDSHKRFINFKGDQLSSSERVDHQSSEPPSGPSVQQHQTQLDSIFLLLEDNIVMFVKNELKKIQRVLSPDYLESLENLLEGEDEQQRRSREAIQDNGKLEEHRKLEIKDQRNVYWVSGRFLRNRVRSSVTHEELAVELLLLHIERSQLKWLRHLYRIPLNAFLEMCSRHVLQGKETLGKTQDRLERLNLSVAPVDAS
ncbi:uncharacterized protein FYW49_020295 [Xenentodon cancila]